MKQTPDLALIIDNNNFFGRAVNTAEPRQWQLRDCRLLMLPLHCKQGEKTLLRGLGRAYRAGCLIAAVAPERRNALSAAPLHLADGRLLALSALTRRLDLDCPGWRKDTVCFSADDNYSCLAARWLAPHSARLHICGENAARRQALALLLYRENGLIATNAPLPPLEALFIQPPGFSATQPIEGAFTWHNWPHEANFRHKEPIPCHLAESLLLVAGEMPQGIKPLPLLRMLNHRGMYHEILAL